MSKKQHDGQGGQGKTETIKQRAIYVYLPSLEMTEEWKQRANKAGVSISKFVVEHVENSLREDDSDYTPRGELVERVRELEQHNKELQKDYDILQKAYERLEDELKGYRQQPFQEDGYKGLRRYDKDLIDLFKRRQSVKSDHLLDHLDVSPQDTDTVKAIHRQIAQLEDYGLLEPTGEGWRWNG